MLKDAKNRSETAIQNLKTQQNGVVLTSWGTHDFRECQTASIVPVWTDFFGLHIVHTRFATWTGINHVSKLKERYHTHQPRTTKMRKTFNYIYIYTYTVHIKTFPLNAGQYCNFTIERRGDEKAAKTTMLMLSRSWSSKLGYLKISFHISHSQQPQQFETVGWFPWWSSIHHTLITPCCWACKTVLFSSMDNHLRRAMADYDFQRSCKYPSLWLVSLPVTIGN